MVRLIPSTSTSGQQEDEHLASGFVVFVDGIDTIPANATSVNTAVFNQPCVIADQDQASSTYWRQQFRIQLTWGNVRIGKLALCTRSEEFVEEDKELSSGLKAAGWQVTPLRSHRLASIGWRVTRSETFQTEPPVLSIRRSRLSDESNCVIYALVTIRSSATHPDQDISRLLAGCVIRQVREEYPSLAPAFTIYYGDYLQLGLFDSHELTFVWSNWEDRPAPVHNPAFSTFDIIQGFMSNADAVYKGKSGKYCAKPTDFEPFMNEDGTRMSQVAVRTEKAMEKGKYKGWWKKVNEEWKEQA
ncbi:hypothetical protein C8J56DRAFT_903024 [Mycena floridula]|nr:hypothetical protein C8J56DRAFT_903024 [Mycena floridula]